MAGSGLWRRYRFLAGKPPPPHKGAAYLWSLRLPGPPGRSGIGVRGQLLPRGADAPREPGRETRRPWSFPQLPGFLGFGSTLALASCCPGVGPGRSRPGLPAFFRSADAAFATGLRQAAPQPGCWAGGSGTISHLIPAGPAQSGALGIYQCFHLSPLSPRPSPPATLSAVTCH